MNKVISTDNRVFMCICGSSGSGKANLILDILSQNKETGGFFNPGFHKVVYYSKYWQPIYNLFNQVVPCKLFFRKCLSVNPTITSPDLIAKKSKSDSSLQIESLFQSLLNHQSVNSGFKTTVGNEKVLAVFDDSCDEILQSAGFANLATVGRHKGVNVIFIKHKLYQQGKFCVTVDKNTTHLLILKSPRIGKQLKLLGSELEFADAKFLQHCYEKATTEPYGHLLIDLSPTCHDALRFSLRICALDENLKNFLLKEKAIGHKKDLIPSKRNTKNSGSAISRGQTVFFLPEKVMLKYARSYPSEDRNRPSEYETPSSDQGNLIIPFASSSRTSLLYSREPSLALPQFYMDRC